MTTHTFTLTVDGPDLQAGGLADEVFEVGCDDAMVGRVDGIQIADFDREADTLEEAVLSVVAELESIARVTAVRVADDHLRAAISAGFEHT